MELWFPGSRTRAFRCSRLCTRLPGFLRTNCASWLRISIRIECNLWSSEQIGFKRAREGGREGGRGEQEEELKNSFLLFLLLVVGVASLLLLDAYLCANSFSKFKRRERWREPD